MRQTDLLRIFFKKVPLWSHEQIDKAIALYQERTKNLVELSNVILSLYHGPVEYVEDDIALHSTSDTGQLITDLIEYMTIHEFLDIHNLIKNFCKERAVKLVAVAQPIRIALTGCATSPGIFDMLLLLGKEESLKRLIALQKKLLKK